MFRPYQLATANDGWQQLATTSEDHYLIIAIRRPPTARVRAILRLILPTNAPREARQPVSNQSVLGCMGQIRALHTARNLEGRPQLPGRQLSFPSFLLRPLAAFTDGIAAMTHESIPSLSRVQAADTISRPPIMAVLDGRTSFGAHAQPTYQPPAHDQHGFSVFQSVF